MVAVAAVFAMTLGHDFVDVGDPEQVTGNQIVGRGLSLDGITWAFDRHATATWHPLTWLSHQLDVQVFGMRAWGHHLVSLLLHLVTVLLVFLLLRRSGGDRFRSALLAALFGLHPLRVEPVAWIAAREDVLGGVLGLLSMHAWLRYGRTPRGTKFLAVMGIFALALMAEPRLATLPIVFLLLDRWPLDRLAAKSREAVFEKLPLVLMSIVAAGLTLASGTTTGAVSAASEPLVTRLGNSLAAYGWYALRTVWPTGLSVFHSPPATVLTGGRVLAATAFILLASRHAWQRRLERPMVLVGWLWFLVTLLPVVGLFQGHDQPWADHYSYLPSIGLLLMAIGSLPADWLEGDRPGIRAVAVTCAVLLALATIHQLRFWRDSATLAARALAIAPNRSEAHSLMARTATAAGDDRTARTHFRKAVELDPDRLDARRDLGLALLEIDKVVAASEQFDAVLAPAPDDPIALLGVAIIAHRRGHLEEARKGYARCIEVDPTNPLARYNLGLLLHRRGDPAAALEHYLVVIEGRDDAGDEAVAAELARASQLAASGDHDGAAKALRRLAAARPGLDDLASLRRRPIR